MKERIREIESKYMGALPPEFSLFQNIPPNKLENAQKSYAPKFDSDESVICLYDDTFRGSAKNGFILTTKRLYFKNMAERSNVVNIANIDKITFKGGFTADAILHLSSGGEAKINLSTGGEALANVLSETVVFLKEYYESGAAAPQIRQTQSSNTVADNMRLRERIKSYTRLSRILSIGAVLLAIRLVPMIIAAFNYCPDLDYIFFAIYTFAMLILVTILSVLQIKIKEMTEKERAGWQ